MILKMVKRRKEEMERGRMKSKRKSRKCEK